MGGHGRGRVGEPGSPSTPWWSDARPGSDSSESPPESAARSTTTDPSAIRSTISVVTRMGACRPGTAAVVMTTSDGGDLVADQLALAGQKVLRLLAGVAARTLLGLETQLDEGGPQRLDLLLGRGRDVIGPDLGPEPPGGGDGLEPGHPRPEHQDLGRGTVPAAVMNMGKNFGSRSAPARGGPVARDRRLGGQGVHPLGPGDPGQKDRGRTPSPSSVTRALTQSRAGRPAPGNSPR